LYLVEEEELDVKLELRLGRPGLDILAAGLELENGVLDLEGQSVGDVPGVALAVEHLEELCEGLGGVFEVVQVVAEVLDDGQDDLDVGQVEVLQNPANYENACEILSITR